MKFRLEIDMDNDAFRTNFTPGTELAVILQTIAQRIDDAEISDLLDADRAATTVRDSYGNSVGSWQVDTLDDDRKWAAQFRGTPFIYDRD